MIEGKFNSKGTLEIRRGSKLKKQYCYLHQCVPCDDTCPLMSEPVRRSKGTTLEICNQRILIFNEFHDDRE